MCKHRSLNVLILAILVVFSVSACALAAAPTRTLTPVTVQLLWTHNAEFAGFYAADQKGYYAAEGLSVTFREGGPNVDYLASVADGMVQFGDAGADELILARAEGKPLCAIATVYRRSPLVFIALADSGINRPQDFVGRVIRVSPMTVAPLHAMMARVGIRPDQYSEVILPSEIAAFASGQASVWSVYLTNFLVDVQQAGHKVNIIYPDDYGVHFYADSIFTTGDLIAKNPDLAARFLRATLKGWTFAVENPTAIGPLVLKYKPDANAALETTKMTAALPLVNTGEDYIGWMKAEVWAGMEKTLREQGVLTKTVDVTRAYTLQFLQEIYGK
jgi:NitT/TauT family transport system substrate-binding protein